MLVCRETFHLGFKGKQNEQRNDSGDLGPNLHTPNIFVQMPSHVLSNKSNRPFGESEYLAHQNSLGPWTRGRRFGRAAEARAAAGKWPARQSGGLRGETRHHQLPPTVGGLDWR